MRALLIGATSMVLWAHPVYAADSCKAAIAENATAAAMRVGEPHEMAYELKTHCPTGTVVTIPAYQQKVVALVCDFSKEILRNDDGSVLCVVATTGSTASN